MNRLYEHWVRLLVWQQLTLISIALLVLVFGGFSVFIHYQSLLGKWKFEEALAELEKRGEPLTWSDLQLNHREAGPDFIQLQTIVEAWKPYRRHIVTKEDQGDAPRFFLLSPEVRSSTTSDNWQDFLKSIEPLRPQLNALRELLREGPIEIPLELSDPYELGSEYGPVINAAHVLELEAIVAVNENRREHALDCIEGMYHLAESATQQGVAIAFLVGLTIEGMADDLTRQMLEASILTEQELIRLSQLLPQKDRRKAFIRMLRCERVWSLSVKIHPEWEPIYGSGNVLGERAEHLVAPLKGLVKWLEIPDPFHTYVEDSTEFFSNFFTNSVDQMGAAMHKASWRKYDQATVLLWTQEVIEKLNEDPAPQDLYLFLDAQAAIYPRTLWHHHALEIFDYLRTFAIRLHHGESLRDQLRVRIAIKRFSLQHSQLPERLDELVPHYISKLPGDLMNQGKPFKYIHGKKGKLLYSVGENGIDDGGEGKEKRLIQWKDWRFSGEILPP